MDYNNSTTNKNNITISSDYVSGNASIVDIGNSSLTSINTMSTLVSNLSKEDIQHTKKEEGNMDFNYGFYNDNLSGVMLKTYFTADIIGICVRSGEKYYAFDSNTDNIMDVSKVSIQSAKNKILMTPLVYKNIKRHDIFYHNHHVYVAMGPMVDNKVDCYDLANCKEDVIILPNITFGFNYVTKLTTVFDSFKADPLMMAMAMNDDSFMKYYLFNQVINKKNDNCGKCHDDTEKPIAIKRGRLGFKSVNI